MVFSGREFEAEVASPVAPGLVRAVMAPLAWLGSRRGLDQRYHPLAAPIASRRPVPARPGAGGASGTHPSPVRPAPSRPGSPVPSRRRAAARRG